MSDIELVIKIPEETYNAICNENILPSNVINVIKNGTMLPKGRGRLIDADAYIDKTAECNWLDDIPVDEFNRITPTIIEADK